MRLFALLLLVLTLVAPGGTDAVSDQLEKSIFELSNQCRVKDGALPLAWDEPLVRAARMHSQDMAQYDFFSHDNQRDEARSTPSRRVALQGVERGSISENIYWAQGYPVKNLPKIVVDGWMKSEGHRLNLLRRESARMGVGVAYKDRTFWVTQVFSE